MIFSPLMTYRHSYPGTVDLVTKQFRRACQMVQLEEGTVLQSSLLFRWRFKGGHILSAAVVAAAVAALFEVGFVYPLGLLFLLKLWLNSYLFSQAFRVKGPLFLAYTVCMSLVMGVSVISGALFGKLQQVLR